MKCKICKSQKITSLFHAINMHGRHILGRKEKFLISRCGNCGVIFPTNIKVNQDYYKKYYQQNYYDDSGVGKNSLTGKFLSLATRLSNWRKERLILGQVNSNNKKVSILDIGCGNGGFLSSLNPAKFDRYGVEISRPGYELSRKRGLEIYHGDINDVDFEDKKFDVVSMWHVLEHIDDPNKLFDIINKILKSEGILIFQIPLTDSLGFRLGKKYWFHLDTPRHLMLYSKKSVRKICAMNKFDIIETKNEFYEYPLDLFWSIRKSKMRFIFYPLYPIVKLFDEETLTFVCRKV